MLRLCLLAVGGVEHISSGYVNHRGLTVFDVCEESGHAKLALWLRGKISVTNTPATGDDASTVAKEGGNEELEYVEPQAEVEAGFYDEHNYDDTYSSPWNAGYNEGERRIDPSDGIAYTYDEFVQYYGEGTYHQSPSTQTSFNFLISFCRDVQMLRANIGMPLKSVRKSRMKILMFMQALKLTLKLKI